MKERLTENFGLKILSLLIAFVMWLIIMNVEDPAIIETFEDIPVSVINEDSLESLDKVYDVISGESVDVKIRGKRSIIESLSKEDFFATANLDELSIVNSMEINVTVPQYGDQVEIVEQDMTTMKISLENLVTEQFRVAIVEGGNVREGYYISEKTSSPNIIQVSGAQSVISKIKEVVVDVSVSGADETFTIEAIPKVYDHNGTLMDPEKMEFSHEEVLITVNLLETKTVKLYLELQGTPASGFGYASFEYEPKEVEIAGTAEELEQVPHILGTYNISNASEDIEDEVDINEFIKGDIMLIGENQNAVVNADIEPLESKNITFPINRIKVEGVAENKTVEFLDPGPITVTVTGLRGEIATITPNNIGPYINMSEFGDGQSLVPVQFETTINNVEFSSINTPIELHDRN